MINIFQLADNDQSIMYLGQVFGNVGVALAGSGSSILANMFKTFNTILLVIGSFFVVYITVVGVMTSAQEGEFMKKWNSLWTPLRMLVGIVALFPTASGYCAIQVVIMWLIVQGIGAADMVWKTTIDYVAQGGSIHPPAAQQDATTTNPDVATTQGPGTMLLPATIQNLFGDLVCQAAMAKFNVSKGPLQYGDESIIGRSSFSSGGYSYNFGPEGICGNASWNNTANNNALAQGLKDTFSSIVPVLESVADKYVRTIIDDPNCWTGTPCVPGKVCWFGKWQSENWSNASCPINNSDSPTDNIAWGKLAQYTGNNFYSVIVQAIGGYANNYVANQKTADAANQQNGSTQTAGISDAYTRAQANGWIFAGAYYYYMSLNVNQNLDAINDFYKGMTVTNVVQSAGFQTANGSSLSNYADLTGFVCGFSKSGSGCDTEGVGGGARGLVSVAKTAMNNAISQGGGEIMIQSSGGGNGGPATDAMDGASRLTIQTWMNNLTNHDPNPIVALQYFGKSLLIGAEVMFWVFLGVIMALGALSTQVVALGNTVNPFSGVAYAILVYVIPFLFALLVYMVSIGALLGIYVPLIPFVIFTFGVLGWFIAVVEALVAAPIVALGILSPGGQHEILGRAEPAVMILLNVFLRPTLMIFGMMAAMLLSYVIINFINGAFLGVVGSITGSGSQVGHKGMGLLEAFLFIMAYAGLVITSLNKCFSLIYVVPEKALRWIGGQAESHGEAEAAEQVKGKVQAGGEAGGKAGGAVGSAAQERGFGRTGFIKPVSKGEKGAGVNLSAGSGEANNSKDGKGS